MNKTANQTEIQKIEANKTERKSFLKKLQESLSKAFSVENSTELYDASAEMNLPCHYLEPHLMRYPMFFRRIE